MAQLVYPARCCPECGSKEYVFRGRKQIPAEQGKLAAIETRYLCKWCRNVWKETILAKKAG